VANDVKDRTKNQINPTLIKAFIGSTQNVLSTMVGVNCQIGKPTLKQEPKPAYDVSGIVSFTGEVVGSVVISFHEATAMKLVEALCCEPFPMGSEDFVDAIGEISNMIAGNAKKEFGLTASIGIPSVIVGMGHSIARLSDVPCIIIPCQSDVGELAVEVSIKQVSTVTA
jgi:chemotaxis protein CheX